MTIFQPPTGLRTTRPRQARPEWLTASGGLALLLVALLALAGCATPTDTTSPLPAGERIVELRSGRDISRAELLAAIRASQYTLLGEQHDNPRHHTRRGELLAALRPPAAVVAEHLAAGKRVVFGADLRASLEAAGFDAKGWRWPLHQPLFAAIAAARLPLTGGNAEREVARRVAREGEAGLPPELAAVTRVAPLDAVGQAALDADLVQGHCGQLAGPRLASMGWAQRARDAAMWLVLRNSGGAPAILVAGNGHVRTDYGVAQLIHSLQPQARLVSVGFVEAGAAIAGAPYTHLWITPGVDRDDPCAGFGMPKP